MVPASRPAGRPMSGGGGGGRSEGPHLGCRASARPGRRRGSAHVVEAHGRVDRLRQPTQAAQEHDQHEVHLRAKRPVAAEGVGLGAHGQTDCAPRRAELEDDPVEVSGREGVLLAVEYPEEEKRQQYAILVHKRFQLALHLCEVRSLLQVPSAHVVVWLAKLRLHGGARGDDHGRDRDPHGQAEREDRCRRELREVADRDPGCARGDGVEHDALVAQLGTVGFLKVL
mmetsp:Transcript_142649/g.371729  ORF Transcript_142649/g.371729 Transcript_142649/m.371729 type:complete len:227 (+) Transcript_142649:133-813(+)